MSDSKLTDDHTLDQKQFLQELQEMHRVFLASLETKIASMIKIPNRNNGQIIEMQVNPASTGKIKRGVETLVEDKDAIRKIILKNTKTNETFMVSTLVAKFNLDLRNTKSVLDELVKEGIIDGS